MYFADRNGNVTKEDNGQDRLLKKMYTTIPGRIVVGMLVNPMVSKIGGKVLSTKLSNVAIKGFCKANNIDLSDYERDTFNSYNDFFTRKIKKERRPIDKNPNHVISPCDSKLSVYRISEDAVLSIKNTEYSVHSLLRDEKLAEKYRGGYACVFRLTVDDYHRYCFIDDGQLSGIRRINGVLHTVNPVANDVYPIYKENSREYQILRSNNFGDVLMMEVGALMVGKISNDLSVIKANRGQEKGFFEFGGSTVILMFKKDRISIDADILENSLKHCETGVKYGEKIGMKKF